MIDKILKISIVIPVYNEGDSLSACLVAIDNLNTKPYEVIVVDNNSTDHTKVVARSHESVRLVTEKKQGVVHARTRGFNAARGNIIARIDADTILPPDWLETVETVFRKNPDVTAVSGMADYYDFVFKDFANGIDRWSRGYLAKRLGDRMFLHGSNMAFKKSAWTKVKPLLCPCDGLHEDLDLAIHLQELGYKVVYEPNMVAGISSRRITNGFPQFVNYCLASPRTYKAHGIRSRRYMYSVVAVVVSLYLPGHIAYESYNPKTGTFSLAYLINRKFRDSRTDPTLNAV